VGRKRCRRHGGAAPSHRVKAARERAAQEVAVAERELELVDATDVLEVALALAHHRSVRSRSASARSSTVAIWRC